MPERVLDTAWQGSVGPAQFRRVVTGDLFGHKRTSVIALDGTSPKLAFAPANHLAITTLSPAWTVNDLDSLLGGPRTRLVGIGSGGLSVGEFDAGNAFQVTATGPATWQGGVMVKAVRYGNSHAVLGLMADQRTMRVGLLTPSTFIDRAAADLGNTVLDFWFADWNNDGALDVVVLTDAGLKIRNLLLAPVTSVANTELPGAMCVYRRRVQDGGDQVFWVRREPNVNHWRVTVWEGGSNVLADDLLLPLSGLAPILFDLVGIRAADGDFDGHADLMVAQRSSSQVALIHGLAAGSGYLDLAQPILLPLQTADGAPLPNLTAVPTFTDLDRDGRADVAACVQDLRKLRVFVGLDTVLDPPQELGPPPKDIFGHVLAFTPMQPTGGPSGQHSGQNGDEFHLLVDIPPQYLGVFPKLEVTLWHQGGAFQGVDPLGYAVEVDLAGEAQQYCTIPLLSDAASPSNPEYLVSNGFWPQRDHFWLEARFIDPASGEVSPSFVLGMTAIYAPGAQDWYQPLASQPEGGDRIDMFEAGVPPHQSGPRLGGGARPRGRIPATVLDDVPLPGPLRWFLAASRW